MKPTHDGYDTTDVIAITTVMDGGDGGDRGLWITSRMNVIQCHGDGGDAVEMVVVESRKNLWILQDEIVARAEYEIRFEPSHISQGLHYGVLHALVAIVRCCDQSLYNLCRSRYYQCGAIDSSTCDASGLRMLERWNDFDRMIANKSEQKWQLLKQNKIELRIILPLRFFYGEK